MKRIVFGSVFVVMVMLLCVVSVCAQDVYYVRRDHTGCEDGSEECPYNTLTEALDAGYAEVCDERTFEVWTWNSELLPVPDYEYYDAYDGQKPIPGTGVPIAMPLLILLVVVAGLILLAVALRLRRQSAT